MPWSGCWIFPLLCSHKAEPCPVPEAIARHFSSAALEVFKERFNPKLGAYVLWLIILANELEKLEGNSSSVNSQSDT